MDPDAARAPEILFTHLMEGIGLALGLKGGRMFVTDFGGSVYSANLDGSNRSTLLFARAPEILFTHLMEGIGLALDLKGGRMYGLRRFGIQRQSRWVQTEYVAVRRPKGTPDAIGSALQLIDLRYRPILQAAWQKMAVMGRGALSSRYMQDPHSKRVVCSPNVEDRRTLPF